MNGVSERPTYAAVTLALCGLPFAGLLGLLWWNHRDAVLIDPPDPWLLGILALLGAALPAGRLVAVAVRLTKDSSQFRLGLLLQMYASLIVSFASLYALLQVSSRDPHFRGMATMWMDEPAGFTHHASALGAVFIDALYMSVVTITTVGFGDIVPSTGFSRGLVAVEALTGVGFIGLVLGHYFSYRARCAVLAADSDAA